MTIMFKVHAPDFARLRECKSEMSGEVVKAQAHTHGQGKNKEKKEQRTAGGRTII